MASDSVAVQYSRHISGNRRGVRVLHAAIPLLAVALAGCRDGSGPDEEALLERFVVMGNSIAAGFESGGIDANSQARSWPVLLTQKAGVSFQVPLLALPGCPAPFVAPLVATRVSNVPCSGRTNASLTGIDNVAVPGERIADALVTTGTPGSLHSLMLGSRSQLQAMRERNPTFVSVELGNNDALAAVLAGDATSPMLTSKAAFDSSVAQLVTQLKALPDLKGAVFLSVIDPVLFAPIVQPGAFFFLARDASGNFLGKPVNANCSPLTPAGQPNPLAQNLISGLALTDPSVAGISCDPAGGTPYLLTPAEALTIRTRVVQFNTALAVAAAENRWAYVELNATALMHLTNKDTNGRYPMLRKCQDLLTATTAAALQTAVLNSCPVTGATAAANLFGAMVSFDGVHPSAAGAVAIANAVITRINELYGTSIAQIQ